MPSSVSAGYILFQKRRYTQCIGLCGTVHTIDLSGAIINKIFYILKGQFCSKSMVPFDATYPKSIQVNCTLH